jgi:hypothetical protein
LLKLAQLIDHHGMTQVEVWSRGIDSEFDPQRPTALELLPQLL